MQTMMQMYREKKITPIQPVTVHDITQIGEALQRFGLKSHLGKFVISYQDPNALVKVGSKIANLAPTSLSTNAN